MKGKMMMMTKMILKNNRWLGSITIFRCLTSRWIDRPDLTVLGSLAKSQKDFKFKLRRFKTQKI